MAFSKAGLVLEKSVITFHIGLILQKSVSPFMREYSYVYFYIVTSRSKSLTLTYTFFVVKVVPICPTNL